MNPGVFINCSDEIRRSFEHAAHAQRYLLTALVDINHNTI
jgi:YD repeat-containing protein